MADFSQILELKDDKLVALHKNLHTDINDSAIVEAHHLVTSEMSRRGLDHGHVDDEWAIAQVEIDSVQSIDLEEVTTSLSDDLAIEVAKNIGISGDVKVVLGINGYEMLIEKSMNEDDDLEFDELAGDMEKTIKRVKGKYVVFSADGSREFGTYDTKSEAERRLEQIEYFKKEDGHKPPKSVREEAKRALAWIAEGKAGDGFTSVGRTRASQLANGESISIETLKRMRSFLARHIVDKKGKGFSRGEEGYPSAGRVAWAAWGGDAGRAWAETILDRVIEKEMYEPEEDLNERQSALYTALEDIVSKYGAFDESSYANGAHYMSAEENPFNDKGMNCANCVFFEGGGGCEILNIQVEPEALCKFWIIPENLIDGMKKHEEHDQSSHGSWAGEGGGSSIASRIKNNLSKYQMQESYGQNYDEGKKAKQDAPRTGKQSYDGYKIQRDKWSKEIDEFPDRSFQAENYAGLLAEAQGFMDGFDGKKPIVPIGKYQLSSRLPMIDEFLAEYPSLLKHGTHDQQSHGNWAGRAGDIAPGFGANEKGQSSSEANQLAKNIREKVGKLEPSLTKTMMGVADEIGAKMEGLQFRLKTEKSLARKIDEDAQKYGGDTDQAARNISDAVRYTMVIDTNNYTDTVTKALDGLRDTGYQASRVKNFWQKGDDYQGINAKMKHPAGFEFELQFHSPESLAMKEKTHAIYEERRVAKDAKTKYKLFERTVRMISKISVPAGVLAVGEIAMNPLIIDGRQILIKSLRSVLYGDSNV